MDWFEIDSTTGIITTKRWLDYDLLSYAVIQIMVVSQDESASPLSSNTSVAITITAVNDNVPRFELPSYEATVSCDQLPADVLTILATDGDTDLGKNVQYSILSVRPILKSNILDLPQFSIDQNGLIRLLSLPFDMPNLASYETIVLAKDDGQPCLSSTTTVRIAVNCIENPSLSFYPSQYFALISPGFYSDLTITTLNLKINPQTSNSIRYNIISGDNRFSIDASTGRLFVENRDFQSPGLFVIQVTAFSDAIGSELSATVYVFVGEITTISFGQSAYYHQVLENTEPHTVLSSVSATVDSDFKLTYQISSGDPNGYFGINNDTGVVSLSGNARIDFEDVKFFNLTIVALLHDLDGPLLGFTTCEFLVTVIDVNDNPPIFNQGLKLNATDSSVYFQDKIVFRLPGDQTYVGNVLYNASSFDCDSGRNGKVTYSLEEPLNALNIDENGLIIVKRPFPASPYDSIDDVTVTSCDNGSPQLCNSFRLHVVIQAWFGDVIATSNAINNVQVRISESTPAGSVILNLADYLSSRFAKPITVGQDGALYTVVSYTLVEEELSNLFGIFPDGQLYLKSADLDRERSSFYCFVIAITVFDGELSYSLNATVNVAVSDANDNRPRFSKEEISLFVFENEPSHTLVGYIRAQDNDVGIHSSLVYLFSEGQNNLSLSKRLPFAIDKYTGAITTTCELDLETLPEAWGDLLLNRDTFLIRITAKDNAGLESSSTFSDDVIVKIQVQDRNEFPPEFSRSFYLSYVTENVEPSVPVLQIFATDSDPDSSLLYQIVSTNCELPFTINTNTGLISVNQSLSREVQSKYSFSATASDGVGLESYTSTTLIQICVLDVNNNGPYFDNATLIWNVSEEANLHQKVGQIIATDLDGQAPNNVVSFKLSNENSLATRQSFRVDESSGYIILTNILDRELQSSYNLVVEASDCSASLQLTTTATVRVNIDDVNDNSPRLNSPKSFSVEEGVYASPIFVGTLSATDEDEANNGWVTFEIFQHTPYLPDVQITLLQNSGQLFLAGNLDREKLGPDSKILLLIQISDSPSDEEDKLIVQDVIEIIVTDINDNDPSLSSPNTILISSSSAQRLGEIATLSVVDLDSGANGSVIFAPSLSSLNQWIRVQPEFGDLELYNALPVDRSNVFTLEVGVQDEGKLVFDTK